MAEANLDLPITDSVADTHAGVAQMVRAGVELIAVLGGDGTHRAVAAHCAASTGRIGRRLRRRHAVLQLDAVAR